MFLLLACAEPLSNDIFYEDAAFLEALPHSEDFDLRYPGEPEVGLESALYFQVTLEALDGFRFWMGLLGTATDTVRAVPPATRSEDFRIWGPGVWDSYPGNFLRLEMSRTSTHDLYVYGFQTSPSSDGTWTGFLDGSWSPLGESPRGRLDWSQDDLAEAIDVGGSGELSLEYDVDAEEGVIAVLHTRRLRLSATAEADTARHELSISPEGLGVYLLEVRMDVNAGELAPVLDDVAIETTWNAEGYGRSAATVDGGDYPYPGIVLWQCWDPDGTLTWEADSQGLLPETGSEEACGI
jgi:hypothetical protein